MNIAVIGGAGFVGSHLIESLLTQQGDTVYSDNVIIIDNFFTGKMSNIRAVYSNPKVKVYREDATQPLLLRTILETEHVEAVFNLAMKCLPTSWLDPEGAYMIGVQIAHNLAYLLREGVYERLIHFSSSEAYGTAVKVPMGEDHPTNPTVPYSAGKLAADILLLSHYKTFDVNVGIVRPFNLIGPRQNWNLYAAIVPETMRRIRMNMKPFITGDGNQTRDFTYVRDVTETIARLAEPEQFEKLKGRVVNFGQGKETRIKEIMQVICEEMDYPVHQIEYAPERAGDVKRHFADISLAKSLFGYEPQTSLRMGVRQTVEWFNKCDLAAQ